MRRLAIAAALLTTGCSNTDECERLINHMLEVQVLELTGDRELAREVGADLDRKTARSNHPAAKYCATMPSDRIACAMKAKTSDEIGACDPELLDALEPRP
jgi:hypothetical protein